MEDFKGTKGKITAKGLHILCEGVTGRLGQAFIMNSEYDLRGKAILDTEGHANAQLWASSLDLLETLKDGVELMEYLINATPSGTVRNSMCDWNIIARSNINKALGI